MAGQTTSRKSVLITGCSKGGIGDGLAQEFHRKGIRVFATARNLSKVRHLKELGMEVIPLDVTNELSLNEAVEKVKIATAGRLDILINNSGSGYQTPILEAEIHVVKAMYDVNLFGVLRTTQAFSPLIIQAHGTIVNIGSIAGYTTLPFIGMYGVSKAALQHLSDTLRQELSPFKVKVIHVVAGGVQTKFWENAVGTKLAENSLYQPIKSTAEFHMRGGALEDGNAPLESFCRSVVANVLKSNPSTWHWVGAQTLKVWLAAAISITWWHTVWDFFAKKDYGMRDLARHVQANESIV